MNKKIRQFGAEARIAPWHFGERHARV